MKDLTPEDGTATSIQFHLFGSFGCGVNDGQVQYTLNGVGFHLFNVRYSSIITLYFYK